MNAREVIAREGDDHTGNCHCSQCLADFVRWLDEQTAATVAMIAAAKELHDGIQ